MATTNNNLNNTIPSSTASAIETFVISNSDNSGTSAAALNISVGGGTTSGDAQTTYVITGANTWSMGAQNSLSDEFTIAHNASLSTSDFQTITTTGANNFPKQPCFLYYASSNKNNVTGNGSTSWIFGSGGGIPRIFDKALNFAGTNFTVPVTGQYFFSAGTTLTNCTVNTGIQIKIGVSGGPLLQKRINRPASSTDISINLSGILSLTATNIVQFTTTGFGEATATESVAGNVTSPVVTFISGYLLC